MYQFADGFDNEGELAPIVPQPASRGTLPGRVTEALDHSEYEDGFQSLELEYSCATAEDAAALLTFFGLTTVRSVQATMSLPLNDEEENGIRKFDNFNVTLKKPVIGKEGTYRYWWKDLKFTVVIEEAL